MEREYVNIFIEKYGAFYKEGKDDPNRRKELGLPKVNQTPTELEEYITKKLLEGRYDEEAFAWKAGKLKWGDNKPELPNEWVNGNGGKITKNKEEFDKESFSIYLEGKLREIDFDNYKGKVQDREGLKVFYEKVKDTYDLENFGTVNIINAMFFLSKGAIPIYDRFAHMAVKALYMNKAPVEIFVADAPGKNDHAPGKGNEYKNYSLAVNVLDEYMWLLKKVFPDEINENGEMYISRELDQALWVYGHAYKNFFDII